eukprot:GHVS01106115.1.p1 GENE.GHVS01106115.1~~GHVS01106115.1.p1  ORF type:complete len:242 (+),score=81.99 GHVS01106115.1:258-983(+)
MASSSTAWYLFSCSLLMPVVFWALSSTAQPLPPPPAPYLSSAAYQQLHQIFLATQQPPAAEQPVAAAANSRIRGFNLPQGSVGFNLPQALQRVTGGRLQRARSVVGGVGRSGSAASASPVALPVLSIGSSLVGMATQSGGGRIGLFGDGSSSVGGGGGGGGAGGLIRGVVGGGGGVADVVGGGRVVGGTQGALVKTLLGVDASGGGELAAGAMSIVEPFLYTNHTAPLGLRTPGYGGYGPI